MEFQQIIDELEVMDLKLFNIFCMLTPALDKEAYGKIKDSGIGVPLKTAKVSINEMQSILKKLQEPSNDTNR